MGCPCFIKHCQRAEGLCLAFDRPPVCLSMGLVHCFSFFLVKFRGRLLNGKCVYALLLIPRERKAMKEGRAG